MDTATELPNKNVRAYYDAYGQPPTESTYAAEYVVPVLESAGYEVDHYSFATGDGAEIAALAAEHEPELSVGNVVAIRTANSGLQLACQLRAAARLKNAAFDRADSPRMHVLTDGLSIARTSDQLKQPMFFQSPYTAIRQIALAGKMLTEASLAA